jgi:indoleamine 2,3-dioxygenase
MRTDLLRDEGEMNSEAQPAIGPKLRKRGFLPDPDPLTAFPPDCEFSVLDEIGRDLPSLLHDRGFRQYARALTIPPWPAGRAQPGDLPLMRLYYVRVGFLASAYINQVGAEPARVLPASMAIPLGGICKLLKRPPILSYDGYALYNWKRFRTDGPIALGNIDTIQNFVHLYDEHWFILVHVEIEAHAARILDAIARVQDGLSNDDAAIVNESVWTIADAVNEQIKVLRRIPEKMDSKLYYKTFRPYIRFFEDVVYEGVEHNGNAAAMRMNFRGETGAQSSIIPGRVHEDPAQTLDAHQPSGRHAQLHAGGASRGDRIGSGDAQHPGRLRQARLQRRARRDG